MSQDEKLRALERELQRSGVNCIVLPKLMHEDLIAFYANRVEHYLAHYKLFNGEGLGKVARSSACRALHNARVFYQRMLVARCNEVEDENIKKLVSDAINDYTVTSRLSTDQPIQKLNIRSLTETTPAALPK